MPKKYPKLRGRTKKLAGQYIAEEVATRRYPLKVARAIGISKAKSEVTKSREIAKLRDMLRRY